MNLRILESSNLRIKLLYSSVIITGFTSIITQILFLRSFLEMFYGNELVIGIVLCNWMLLTGIGSYIGKFSKFKIQNSKFKIIIIFQILISLIPLFSVFLITYLKNIIFPVGSMVSLVPIFISSFIVLLPYCLLSGFIIILLCLLISELNSNNKIGKVYGFDVIGSIIGGIIFNTILIFYFKTFQSLILLMFINLISALILSLFLKKKIIAFITSIIIVLAVIAGIKYNLDYIAKQLLYKEQNVILIKDTPYGNIVITKTAEQINFYENGVFLYSTQNLTEKEEDVHYAMLQHPAPKNILLVSGGISGTTDEILKYKVDRIDYVEINPYLVEIAKEFNKNLDNPKINIINTDAICFLQNNSAMYDVALINVPPPTTAQLNRFYTIEFFNNLKKHLNRDGVISVRLMSTEDYVNKAAKQLNSVLYNTLNKVFKNVLIIPGGKNYFIASDNKLDINIAHLSTLRTTNNKLLTTNYVNQYYIDDELLKRRSDFILNSLDKNAPINKDFSPVAYYEQLQYWLSYFNIKYQILNIKYLFFIFILIFSILFLIFYLTHNLAFSVQLSLFTTGFTASAVEFLLLVYFQVMYGFVYQMTGIMITLFMFGIAAGVHLSSNSSKLKVQSSKFRIRNYIFLIFCLAAYAIAIPFILILLRKYKINPTIIEFVFFFIIIDIGTLTGMIFQKAVNLQKNTIQNVAANSIGSDMIGSALGVLLVSAFLLPLLGLIKVSIIIGLLNIISGVVLMTKSAITKSNN